MSENNEAVWKRPGWITAIVGVISIFLTVPEIVGNYYAKEQEIKLEQQKTESVKLQNTELKLEQEYRIVKNTLAQQGTERVFVLRYLAETLDDVDAKRWANNEVKRLDDIASLEKDQKALQERELELEKKISQGRSDNVELEKEITVLRTDLQKKDSEVSELKQKAGISEKINFPDLLLVSIHASSSSKLSNNIISLIIDGQSHSYLCQLKDGYCQFILEYKTPEVIEIVGVDKFEKLHVSVISDVSSQNISMRPLLKGLLFDVKSEYLSKYGLYRIPYICKQQSDKNNIICNRQGYPEF